MKSIKKFAFGAVLGLLMAFSPLMPMFDDIDLDDLNITLGDSPLTDLNLFNSIDPDNVNNNEISLNSIQYQQPNTTMTAPMEYTCRKWCKEKFSTVKDLRKHEDFLCIDTDSKTHPNKEPCFFCGNWYYSRSIVQHQAGPVCKDYALHNAHQCELCLKRFPQESLLLEHKNGCNVSENVYHCQWCNQTFSILFEQKKHEQWQCKRPRRSRREKPCENCKQLCWQGSHNHPKNVCDKFLSENKYQCYLCERRFPSQTILDYHQQIHMQNNLENNQLNFTRVPIMLNFFRAPIMMRQQTTNNDMPHDIDISDIPLLDLNELDSIYSGETNDNEISLDALQYQQPKTIISTTTNQQKDVCLYCGGWYLRKSMLQHQDHSECKSSRINNAYQCELCLKRFSKEGLLLEHKNECRRSEDGYHCQGCDKILSTLLEQKKHEKWQCIKPFDKTLRQCHNCQEWYSNDSNHPKKVCKNFLLKNKYQCDLCKRRFPGQTILDYHQQIHVQNNQSQISQGEQRIQNQPEQMELSNCDVSQREVFEEIIEEESDHTSYPLNDDYWGDTFEVYPQYEHIESRDETPVKLQQTLPSKQYTIRDEVAPLLWKFSEKKPEKEEKILALMPLVNQLKEDKYRKNPLWVDKIGPRKPTYRQRFNDQSLDVKIVDSTPDVTLALIANVLKDKKLEKKRTLLADKIQCCESQKQIKKVDEFIEDDIRYLQSGVISDWSDDEGLKTTGSEKTIPQSLPKPQEKKQQPLFVMPKILPKTQELKPIVLMGSKVNDNNQRIVLPRSMPNLTMHSVNDTMCDRCGRWYSSEHLKKECTQYILHNSYQCKLCKERFPSSTRLEVHQKMCKPQPQINLSSNVLVQPSRHSFQQYVVNIPQNSLYQAPQALPLPSVAQKRQLEEKKEPDQKQQKK